MFPLTPSPQNCAFWLGLLQYTSISIYMYHNMLLNMYGKGLHQASWTLVKSLLFPQILKFNRNFSKSKRLAVNQTTENQSVLSIMVASGAWYWWTKLWKLPLSISWKGIDVSLGNLVFQSILFSADDSVFTYTCCMLSE